MPTYQYKAVDDEGATHCGVRRTKNRQMLSAELAAEGLWLVRVRRQRRHPWHHAAQHAELFFIQLELQLSSGLPLDDALDLIAGGAVNAGQTPAALLRDAVRAGQGVSTAAAAMPECFSALSVARLQVGERTGNLAEAAGDIHRAMAWSRQLQQRLRRILVYPCMLSIALLLVAGLMMVYVVPGLVGLVTGFGRDLPMSTRVLLWISAVLQNHWVVLVVACLSGIGLLVVLWRCDRSRLVLERRLLQVPVVGRLLLRIRLARLSQAMAVLLNSGIGLLDALVSARAVLGSLYLEVQIDEVHARVLAGQSLSVAFRQISVIPHEFCRLLETGEHSGNLAPILAHAARLYDGLSSQSLATLESRVSTTLLLLMGGLLLWIVIAVLGPLYDSLSVVEGY